MSRILQMYPELPRLAIEMEPPRGVDHKCQRCSMHDGVKTVCMEAEVSSSNPAGSLLLVSDYPGEEEDRRGRPMIGATGRMLRYLTREHWKGPIVIDNALKCRAAGRVVRDTHVRACRGYLAQTLREAKPQRVVVMGSQAILSVLGRAVPPLSARRGYSWLISGQSLVPVFLLFNPAAGLRNKFVRQWFEHDFKWALTVDVAPMRKRAFESWEGIVNVVETVDDAKQAHAWAKAQPRWISYDFETSGKAYEKGTSPGEPPFKNLCASIGSPDDADAWAWDERALRFGPLREWLKKILEDPSIKKAGQNEKYDRHCAEQIGIVTQGYIIDTRLMRKLHDPEVDARLETMQELVGLGGGKLEMQEALAEAVKLCRQKPTKKDPDRGSDEALEAKFGALKMPIVRAVRANKERHQKYSYGLVDQNLLIRYNAIDSRSTSIVAEQRQREMDKGPQELKACWEGLVRPLSVSVGHMERWGIHVDRDMISAFQSVVMLKQQDSFARIQAHASSLGMPEFNPSKTDHVSELLFKRMRIRPTEMTPTGKPSTNKDVLKDMAGDYPIINDILEWRAFDKKKGTYADPLSAHIRSDGRVHPSIKLDGARSGRPSCEDPNLFNIPRPESPEGKMARDCFTAPTPDHRLYSFDYSQLELRVAAMESGDESMQQIFIDGDDYHQRTAQMVSQTAWGIPPEAVEKKHRTEAKSINFGVLYGMGAWTLAAKIGCSAEQAERTMMAIMGRFRKLDRYCKARLAEAQRTGYIWTTWNEQRFRRRPMWRVADKDSESRSRAEHGTWNTPIQGKASDFCLWSLVAVVNWIVEEKIEKWVKLVLTVYDQLLLEVHKSFYDEVMYVVPKLMLQHPSQGVPIVVDAEQGRSWGSLEKIGSFSNMTDVQMVARAASLESKRSALR